MIVIPPELVPFSYKRYLADLGYRCECDAEIAAERADRIKLLFNPTYQANV